MSSLDIAVSMLTRVASALDSVLLDNIAFVGGCTTGLLVTDEFSRQQVRFTDDVDLIVNVLSKSGWYQLRDELLARGFSEAIGDTVSCRMRLGELKVDFMPDDAEILGFTNRWYRDALAGALPYQLQRDITIKVVTPPHFVATKLEAYKGRGNDDPLASHDIEDILTLFDGRPELIDEIVQSDTTLAEYIAGELNKLLQVPGFEYAMQSTALNDEAREQVLLARIQQVTRKDKYADL